MSVPKCAECILCTQKRITEHGPEHDYCNHSAWSHLPNGTRWIKATAKGRTSPKWCPLRKDKTNERI